MFEDIVEYLWSGLFSSENIQGSLWFINHLRHLKFEFKLPIPIILWSIFKAFPEVFY